MAATGSARTITEDQLSRWHELNSRRAALEKEARTLKAEADLIAEDVMTVLETLGRTEVRRGEFIAEVRETPGSVAWKQAFLEVAGAEAAAKLQAAAVPGQRFTVRSIA